MEGLHEPLDPAVRRLLRRLVSDHAVHDPRRSHPPHLNVGRPGASIARLAVDPGDRVARGLGADVVAAMRAQVLRHDGPVGEPVVWVSRTGVLDVQDVDLRWLVAARAAYAEADAELRYVVVNRRGWRDPRSGLSRTWVRPRPLTRV